MRRPLLALLTIALLSLTACSSAAADGSGTPAPTPYPTLPANADRPSTPVKITLISPVNGSTVHGTSVLVRVSVSGGAVSKITVPVGSPITPTLGHVHLYLNNQLIYMQYTLQEAVPVQPGVEYSMYAEFVAQDHFPFSPRDVTPTIFFTVAPA